MRRGLGPALLGVAALVVVAAVGWGVLREGRDLLGTTERCTAEVDGLEVELVQEQAENASLIAAIGMGRGLPARATSIALATAYQESDLYNIDYGDRDSVGLFQQRPSQGWGSVEEILDPVYSTNAFFDALEKVDGYQGMEITVAAQEVQRSAFPDAYADHEQDARVLASALTGNSGGAFTCEVSGRSEEDDPALTDSGLTARAERVRAETEGVFPGVPLGGFAPGGVREGHIEGSAHYDGRAVDAFVRPVNEANNVRGWMIAHYYVAHATRLDVQTVIFDAQIWSARRSDEGWRPYDVPDRGGDLAILEHRDHVHVDVFA